MLGVYGTILPANGTTRPISSYSIDGASPSTFEPPDNITTRQDNQLFFVSDELSSGQHTLTVSINQVNLHDPVLIDYILIASETSGNAGQATETYRTTSLTGLPTTSAQADALAASSGPPAGPIIGGVVGGVAVLVAAALVVYFFWYRRRHNGYYYHPADDIDHGTCGPLGWRCTLADAVRRREAVCSITLQRGRGRDVPAIRGINQRVQPCD